MAEDKRDKRIQNSTLSQEAKYHFHNSLTGLVKSLQGLYTTVDLRNEGCVTGKITFVDALMNVEMEDVVFCDARGAEHVFPNFFISQRNIRYVHIPRKRSATDLIQGQLAKMAHKKTREQHTFKKVRAKRYNAEIAQSAFTGETSSKTSR